MVTCPWCGTNYVTFQSNCSNCGGPLPAVDEKIIGSTPSEVPSVPPAAPRSISDRYIWRLLSTDGWSIAAFVFGILGFVFTMLGVGLSTSQITAFVGIPFLVSGIFFLGTCIWVFVHQYQKMNKVVTVLRVGQAVLGQIIETQANYSVVINGRNPWVIRYQFQVEGQEYTGSVTTLNQPREQLQAGKSVYVLYLSESPKWNSIYPHP
jgi:hypothetical protein